MNFLHRSLRHALLTLLALPLLALAAPHYLSLGGVSFAQNGGPILTSLGNGTTRWVTNFTVTNNNAFGTNELYFLVDRQWADGSTAAEAMQWDNAAGIFRRGSSTGEADNEALFIALDDTDLSPPPAVFSVAATDSLAAFSIGSLAAGAGVAMQMNFIMSDDVNPMFFNGHLVQAVPEPQTLALVTLCIVGGLTLRRRRNDAS